MLVSREKKHEKLNLDADTLELCKSRYATELDVLTKSTPPNFKFINADEKNRNWSFTFSPENPPYNGGFFHLSVLLPKEYPYRPPSVNFMTKILHPNVDASGAVHIPGLRADDWKPTLRVYTILTKVAQMINDLDPSRPLRPDLAEMVVTDEAAFISKATEFTKSFAEKK